MRDVTLAAGVRLRIIHCGGGAAWTEVRVEEVDGENREARGTNEWQTKQREGRG